MKAYLTQQVKFLDDDILVVTIEREEFSIQITPSRKGFLISAAFPLELRPYGDELHWEIDAKIPE